MGISQQRCTLQLGFKVTFNPLSALTSIHHAEPYSPSIPLRTAPLGPNLADRLTLLAVGSPEEEPVSEMHC